MNNKERSPFTPGSPVPVELFVGRAKQIQEIVRYIDQAVSGRQMNVFLAGDRGIGKTSMAAFLSYLKREDIFGVHVFLGGVSSLEEMVCHVFDQILKQTKGEPWFDKIQKLFGDYIHEIGLFGVSVSFSPPKEDLRKLVRAFPETLNNLLTGMADGRRGLLIALDDINGLAEKVAFADWYKSFADEVATRYKDFPVLIMPIGLPEKRDALSNLQPSLMRIFRVVDIERLTDDEVRSFLYQAFEIVDMEIELEALDVMTHYSSGLPILMHEIGDATFWIDSDGIISQDDAAIGVLEAAERIGKKYLDPKVYRALRSERYRSILKKVGLHPTITRHFKKKDVEATLSENEKKVFANFLTRLKKLGVIESDVEKGRGAYRFVNEIYPVYIWMQSGGLEKRTRPTNE